MSSGDTGAEWMSKIAESFQALRARREGAFIPYITLGDPTAEASLRLIRILDENGADIIELGIPYSDPLADGPTIQASHHRALSVGMNTDKALHLVAEARAVTHKPLVLLNYYNLILQRGVEQFFKDAATAGANGVIVPDLPVEESGEALVAAAQHGVDLIFLIAPTTGELRLQRILQVSRGFIYLVALLGVTGARDALSTLTRETISRITHHTQRRIPIAVGFGISRPSHVREVLEAGADGAIVGSAIIDRYATRGEMEAGFKAVAEFAREPKEATRL